MTPPIRRRSLSEIADSTLGAAEDPFKPTRIPRMGSESTGTKATARNATPEQVAKNKRADVGLLRQAAQGASFGFADEIEAGAKALGGANYRTTRDQIRNENEQYVGENPGASFGANLAGGVLTGAGMAKLASLLPMLRTAGLAPSVQATATSGQRALQAAKLGGVGGALTGAGVAPEMDEALPYVAGGAAAGAAGGAVLSGVSDGVRNVRNVLGQLGQGEQVSKVGGVVRGAIQAERPQEAAARRVLQAAGRGGQSMDDVAARVQSADPQAAMAELVGNGQGVRSLRIARNVGRERDQIDKALFERAAEEPANWYRTVARETGVSTPRDPKAVGEQAMAEIRQRVRRLYGKANQQPDVADPRIAEAVETLGAMPEYGPAALKRARTLAAAKGDAFPETFRPEGAPAGATRTAGGRLKDFAKASDDALVDEYERLTTRMQRDIGQSQYNVVEADVSGTQYGQKILTANTKGGGPSMQAKAQRRVQQTQGVLDRIEFELNKRGKYVEDELARRAMNAEAGASSRSGTLADLFGDEPVEAPPAVNAVRVKDMLRLRKGIDEVMRGMRTEIDGGKGSPELFESMGRLRRQVDRAYKAAGGKAARKADRLTERAKARGESFAQGGRVEQAGTAEEVARLARTARDPEALREGAASKLLERVSNVADGEMGQVRNPVQGPLGSETRRARTRAAFPDDDSFARARADAEKIAGRLLTRQQVSGNSTTAANQMEIADEFMSDPGKMIGAAANPMSIPRVVAERIFQTGTKGVNAAQATEMGRILSAGLPGQMTREQALEILRKMEPVLRDRLTRQLIGRNAVTQSGLGAALGRGR